MNDRPLTRELANGWWQELRGLAERWCEPVRACLCPACHRAPARSIRGGAGATVGRIVATRFTQAGA